MPQDLPVWVIAPFVLMLATIAAAPLIPGVKNGWARNRVKLAVALILGVPTGVAVWVWLSPQLVLGSLAEYAEFIVLLASLFVVSGGVFLEGDLRATPRNNVVLLALGGVLASLIGTTGAAMLMIRLLLNANREREYKAHTVIFSIFIVANCGGLLTPLGDPPLYLGLMRGVPFTWTLTLMPQWLFINGLLLVTYLGLERRFYSRESEFALAWDEASRTPLKMRGKLNIVWLVLIIASVAFLGEWVWVKILVQIGAGIASYLITDRRTRFQDNEFTWSPIVEVAVLFLGIFLTMVPALAFLRANAGSLPLNEYTFFGFTGALSSVLDNAPTYLTFFEMGTQMPGDLLIAGVPHLYLTAISLGAVTCGAITYIGNGPNFMVKAVAEERGVVMPSFGGYVVWAVRYLVPVLVAMVCLFLSPVWWVKLTGGTITAVIVVLSLTRILKNRQFPPRQKPAGQ